MDFVSNLARSPKQSSRLRFERWCMCICLCLHVLMVLTLPTLQATGELLCEISLFMHSLVCHYLDISNGITVECHCLS